MRPKIFSATTNVLILLCIMYAMTYIDRNSVSTAAFVFKKELHLSNTQVGLVFSAFAYPYLIFQIIGGWVSDRFGARLALRVSAVIWGSATLLTGKANGLVALVFARVLRGFGEGATFPTATRAMSDWIPKEKRGFAQGITHSSARLGNALTPPLVAWLITVLTWRGSFIILGIVSLAWAAVWGWYFRDDPARPGSASGLMNSGTAFAAIISPLVFGYVIDKTGNWELPFLGSIGLLFVGAILAFWMKPDEALVGRGADGCP